VSDVVLVGAEIPENIRGTRDGKCRGEEAADRTTSAARTVRVEREDKLGT